MSSKDTRQKFLFLTLGAPGSGKSYVSEWLAPRFNALTLKSDAIRAAMFNPVRSEHHKKPYSSMINGVMTHFAEQALSQNISVIYDTNNSSILRRKERGALANGYGALPVVVWVKTPLENAKERATIRDAQDAGRPVDMSYVEMMASGIEAPTDDELVIIIDGLASENEQKESFDLQLKRVLVKA